MKEGQKRGQIIRFLFFTLTILFIGLLSTFGQEYKLKSAKHGLDLIHAPNVDKKEIIEDTRFTDGEDKAVDILRFDNVGTSIWGKGPLIISSKEPITVDSLGLIPLKLQTDSLTSLINLIETLNTKVYKRIPTDFLFRITYRFKGEIKQYYVGYAKESTEYFKEIEKRIMKMSSKEMLQTFYFFLWPTRLLKKPERFDTYSPPDKPEWVY